MKTVIEVKVNLSNGDSFETRINATEQEARSYYEGKIFNVGAVNDDMQKCVNIEILEDK